MQSGANPAAGLGENGKRPDIDTVLPAELRRAIDDLVAGRVIVVRLNGRDPVLMCAARGVNAETVSFMVRHTSGFLCVALPARRADELQIPPMHYLSDGAFEIAYGVSVDADAGIETGISARDRAVTIGLIGDPSATADQFRRPGHVMTLRARPAGLRARTSFTEAAVDLALLCGLPPAMAMAELVSTRSPGHMMHGDEVADFCNEHGLESITVAQIPAGRSGAAYPPIDAEVASALATLDGLPVTVRPEDIERHRLRSARVRPSDGDLSRGGSVSIDEVTIPGPAGDLALLICRPTGRNVTGGVLYLHGGGMILGDNRSDLLGLLDWVGDLGLVLVSADYRLAPENPHPAPVEDCYAALSWFTDHASEQHVSPERILVAGESAGGGLAAAVSLMARDRGGPQLSGQMLICPMLDDRAVTPSSMELDGQGIWDRTSNATGWSALLGSAAGGAGVSPYAAPARADDLGGLPPAFIEVGSTEVFRDEAVDYAQRIWRAGGAAELHVWPGGVHCFDGLAPRAAISRSARAARADWLTRLLVRPPR